MSFARISMFSNGTLSSAAAGGINVNTNVIARLQAMLTCACRRYTIDSFAERRNGDFQHDGLQLREHHTCCCRRKLYNHGRRAPVSVPCFVCVFDMQLYCCCRLLLRARFICCRYDTFASVSSSRFIGCNSTCVGEFCASQSSGIASLSNSHNAVISLTGTSFDLMLIACDGGPGGYCSSQGGALFAVVSEFGQSQNVSSLIQASSVIGSFCTALVSSRSDPLSVASGGFLYTQGSSGVCDSF